MIIKKEIKSEKKIQKEDFSLYLEKGINSLPNEILKNE